jgi:hypothetical protein
VIGQIARRLKTSPEQVTKSLSQLQRHGHISLTSRGGCVLLRHYAPAGADIVGPPGDVHHQRMLDCGNQKSGK